MTIFMLLKMISKLIPLLQEVILGDRTIFRFIYEHFLYLFLLFIITLLAISLYNTRYELRQVSKALDIDHVLEVPIVTTVVGDVPITPIPSIPKPKEKTTVIRNPVDTRSLIRSRLTKDTAND